MNICPKTGKHIHPSQGKALAHLRNLQSREEMTEQEMNVYACEHCRGWHVGHSKQIAHKNKYKDKK